VQRELYEALKIAATYSQSRQREGLAVMTVRDSEVRDALIFLARLGVMRTNGRPKSRAFLDFLRRFHPVAFAEKPASTIVIP
jgi:hypothetical protein